MKKVVVILLVMLSQQLWAQYVVTGKVVDSESGQALPNVQIVVEGSSSGGITDDKGVFRIEPDVRKGMLQFAFVGYQTTMLSFSFKTESFIDLGLVQLSHRVVALDEVTISAGLADRTTDPVSVTEISSKTIRRQLNDKPLPLLFNTISGVYSTTSGGGSGDAVMSIRGFKQENVGLLLNGVPVNGVENGLVYWSNWQGLTDASASIQIQKGPGVANMAANAVGGSVNIITYNANKPQGGNIAYQVTSYGNQKISLALNSGKRPNGWSLSFLGSHENGPGYVDATFVKSWGYYFSATKRFSKTSKLNITLMGSPQQHGQRTLKLSVQEVKLHGYRYNKDWGGYEGSMRNASQNFYHKPFLSVNHYLTFDDTKKWANSFYVSYGSGGGLWSESFNYAPSIFSYRSPSGQLDWEAVYNNNANHGGSYVLANGDTVSGYSMNVQTKFLASHMVAGWLSTYEQKLGRGFKLVAGLHYRYFNSFLREEVSDLLGGKFFIEDYGWAVDGVAGRDQIKMPGDIIRVNNNSVIHFMSAYAQLLYDSKHWNGYVSLNQNNNVYRRIDRFNYIENQKSEPVYKPGFDIRAGLANLFSDRHKIYMNAAWLSRAPYFKYVFGNFTNVPVTHLKNETVATVEFGYQFHHNGWYVTVDGYYTGWNNVSMLSNEYIQLEDNTQTRAMVNGLNAVHKGVETTIGYRWKNRVDFNFFGSLGNYQWQNDVEATLFNDSNVAVDTVFVYASGLRVGGTAQQQMGGSVNFSIFSFFNLKAEWIWFGKLYADFDPVNRNNPADRLQPYQFPSYNLLNMYVNFPFLVAQKQADLDLSLNNVLNNNFITLGQDGLDHSLNTFRGFWSEGLTVSARLSLYF